MVLGKLPRNCAPGFERINRAAGKTYMPKGGQPGRSTRRHTVLTGAMPSAPIWKTCKWPRVKGSCWYFLCSSGGLSLNFLANQPRRRTKYGVAAGGYFISPNKFGCSWQTLVNAPPTHPRFLPQGKRSTYQPSREPAVASDLRSQTPLIYPALMPK